MKNRILIVSVLLFFSFNSEVKSKDIPDSTLLQLSEVKLIARDVFASAKWYVKNLNFKVKKAKSGEYVFLENGNFKLNIFTAKRTVTASQVRMPENKERINGFYEIGFLCSDIDSLMYQYEGRGIRILKDPSYDPEYKTNTVILADPDGNRVKLFQASKNQLSGFKYFKPNYFLITTSDIETGFRWYTRNLGFKEVTNNYSERARTSYCVMQKDELTIELQELSGRTMEITELLDNQIELTRFEVLTITSKKKEKLSDLTDNDGNKLRF